MANVQTNKSIVHRIYNLRRDFVLIGLTGRTGSGCSTVAKILKADKVSEIPTEFKPFGNSIWSNDSRKNKIVHDYMVCHWHPFTIIKASDVIFYYALDLNFDEFIYELTNRGPSKYKPDVKPQNADKQNLTTNTEASSDLLSFVYKGEDADMVPKPSDDPAWSSIKDKFENLKEIRSEFESSLNNGDNFWEKKNLSEDDIAKIDKYTNLILCDISKFRDELQAVLDGKSTKIITSVLQKWGNNIRKFDGVKEGNKEHPNAPGCLAEKIDCFIWMIRAKNKINNEPTFIAIDALRNPFEILVFRERYATFYMFSISTEDRVRRDKLIKAGFTSDLIEELEREEKSKGNFPNAYANIDIDKCIELSDVHLTHDGIPFPENRSLNNQIVTYVSLIRHPGLVPPSPDERVMQIAYTCKLNSGCLRRQIGAVVTNSTYSVLAVGWNTTAGGQTPCSLRSLLDLCTYNDEDAFSEYERDANGDYHEAASIKCNTYIKNKENDSNNTDLMNLPYVFCPRLLVGKDDKIVNNYCRSIYAEENAFLQLAKYSKQELEGAKLFTTSNCCEECTKMAHQLGIKEIIYIDTNHDKTPKQIVDYGKNKPEKRLFHGATGRAYVNFYNPLLPFKDEVEALIGPDESKKDGAKIK